MAAGIKQKSSVSGTKAEAFNTPFHYAHLASAPLGRSQLTPGQRIGGCGTKTVAQVSQLLGIVCPSRGNTSKTNKKQTPIFPSLGVFRPVREAESEKSEGYCCQGLWRGSSLTLPFYR